MKKHIKKDTFNEIVLDVPDLFGQKVIKTFNKNIIIIELLHAVINSQVQLDVTPFSEIDRDKMIFMIRYKIITEKDLHSETVTEKLTKFNKLLATFQLIMHSLRYLFKKYYEAIESLSHHCKYQMPHNFNNFLEKTEIMHLLFS